MRAGLGGLFALNRGRWWFLEDALVMVVEGDGESLLGVVLADARQVQPALNLGRFRGVSARFRLLGLRREILVQNLFAQEDAVVADINSRPGNELPDLSV